MSYIQETLSDDEEIKKIFKLNILAYFPSYMTIFLGVLFFITALFLGLTGPVSLALSFLHSKEMVISLLLAGVAATLYGLVQILLLNSIEMGTTNKRVILKRGFISVSTDEMRLSAIEGVEVEQSIMGRILGFGNVEISGRGASKMLFKAIDDPKEVRKNISGPSSEERD